MFVMCETVGCQNLGHYVQIPDADSVVVCGPCGQPITRIENSKPEELRELPAWEI